MSDLTKLNPENTEPVRELVIPAEPAVEAKDGDRSPRKTKLDASINSEPETDVAKSVEVVRELVVPTESTEIKDDDRTPTKTERGIDI